MDVRREIAALREALICAGTRERAEGEARYLKSDLEFLGATVPAVRKQAGHFARAHPDLERDSLVALVEGLWRTRVHELRTVGIALLDRYSDRLAAKDIALCEAILRKANTWAHVDWLSIEVVGALFERYRGTLRVLRRWARDEALWLRRAALLAHLRSLRRGDGDFALFCSFADPMLEEREFFIRKAIGWVLREAGKARPELVRAYVATHGERMSGLTRREATRNL